MRRRKSREITKPTEDLDKVSDEATEKVEHDDEVAKEALAVLRGAVDASQIEESVEAGNEVYKDTEFKVGELINQEVNEATEKVDALQEGVEQNRELVEAEQRNIDEATQQSSLILAESKSVSAHINATEILGGAQKCIQEVSVVVEEKQERVIVKRNRLNDLRK